jgi:septal ring factor EnvC (AmiA/AmiB activator)
MSRGTVDAEPSHTYAFRGNSLLRQIFPDVGAAAAGGGEIIMSDASAIDAASRRLSAALDALEAAAERRRQADHGEDKLAAQVQALGTDRSKLAADLDAQAARCNRLETTNREVARRLDLAIDTIRTVLDAHER